MSPVIESVLRRDRLVVGLSLILVTSLSWAYILAGAGMGMDAFEMTRHSRMSMDMMDTPVWTASYTVLMFFMWWIMMVAMMLPSASPAILLAAALNRRSKATQPPFGPTGLFAAAYLLAWAGFSMLAVSVQWWMQNNGWLNNMLVGQSQTINGLLLLLAGLWQFSPLKYACLRHCQSPVGFLTQHRHPGKAGALRMGLLHGAHCLGCCWFLMALLFVGGVMNLYWIVGLALYVWVEKMLPASLRVDRLMGILLLICGGALLTGLIATNG